VNNRNGSPRIHEGSLDRHTIPPNCRHFGWSRASLGWGRAGPKKKHPPRLRRLPPRWSNVSLEFSSKGPRYGQEDQSSIR